MDRASPEVIMCPACHARNFAIDDSCSSCKAPLTIVIGDRIKIRRFNLFSIMVVIAVVALSLAPIRVAPAWSIILFVILVPSTVRGFLAIEERKADGRPMNHEETAQTFVASFAITTVIAVSALGAFTATCVPIGALSINFQGRPRWSPGMLLAVGSGSIAAFTVIYLLSKKLWPRKD